MPQEWNDKEATRMETKDTEADAAWYRGHVEGTRAAFLHVQMKAQLHFENHADMQALTARSLAGELKGMWEREEAAIKRRGEDGR